jgi:hypothetical protein
LLSTCYAIIFVQFFRYINVPEVLVDYSTLSTRSDTHLCGSKLMRDTRKTFCRSENISEENIHHSVLIVYAYFIFNDRREFFVYLTCIYLTGTCIHIISYNKTNCNEIIYTTDGVYGEILHTHTHSLILAQGESLVGTRNPSVEIL